MIFYPTSLWVVALYLPATLDHSHPYFVPSWSILPYDHNFVHFYITVPTKSGTFLGRISSLLHLSIIWVLDTHISQAVQNVSEAR